MTDLRAMLQRKAGEVRPPASLPPVLLRRARWSRVRTSAVSLVVGAALIAGAGAGLRTMLLGEPRPYDPGAANEELLPIWPAGEAEELDALQESADDGGSTQLRSAEGAARAFAVEVLGWDEGDVRVAISAAEATSIAVSNPALAQAANVPGALMTRLTLARWEGREDGIFVVTQAFSDDITLRGPRPGEPITEGGAIVVAGRLRFEPPPGTEVVMTVNAPAGVHSEQTPARRAFWETLPAWTNDDRPPFSVALMEGARALAYASFRLGPVVDDGVVFYPLPGEPTVAPSADPFVDGYETEDVVSEVLPRPTFRKAQEIRAAAYGEDWDILRKLISPSGFAFSPGTEGDPIEFWQGYEGEGRTVLSILVTLLELPNHGKDGDTYIWPEAATEDPEDWSEADVFDMRRIYSARQVEAFREGGEYTGWSVGIDAEGTWRFFVDPPEA